MKKNILIIGGSSLVGSTFVEMFYEKYNLISTYHHSKPTNSIKFKIDLTKKNAFNKLQHLENKLDFIIWCAQDHKSKLNQKINQSVNFYGLQMAIEFYKKTTAKNFLFFSTGSVYKNSKNILLENSEIFPESYYGWSKLFGEKLCFNYHKEHKLNFIIFRPFYIFGKNQKDKLFFEIKKNKIEKKIINFAKCIGMTFNYCFLDDLCRIIDILINSKNTSFDVFNISSDKKINIKTLINEIDKQLKTKTKIQFTDDTTLYSLSDNSKIKEKIKYFKFTKFEDSIRSFLG